MHTAMARLPSDRKWYNWYHWPWNNLSLIQSFLLFHLLLLPHVFIICKIHWNLLREREYRCFMLANVVLIQPEAAFFKVCVSQLSVVCAAACLVGKDKIIDEWVFCCQIFQGIELEDTWARAHFLCDCATFGWITPIYHLSAMAQTEVEMGIRRYRYYSIIYYSK